MKIRCLVYLFAAFICLVSAAHSEDTSPEDNLNPRLSTDQVENQIVLDKKANPLYESRILAPLRDWRDGVAEKTGFNWSNDYSALFMGSAIAPVETMPAAAWCASSGSGIWSPVAAIAKAV